MSQFPLNPGGQAARGLGENLFMGRCGNMQILNKIRSRIKSYTFGDKIQEILMILPMFIGFLLFVVYPIFWVLRWAWFNYNGHSHPVFIGFDNFVRAFSRDKTYWFTLL